MTYHGGDPPPPDPPPRREVPDPHTRRALMLAAIALVIAIGALIGLVWAVAANALTSPIPTTSTTSTSTTTTVVDSPEVSPRNLYIWAVAIKIRMEEQRLWARWGPVNICEQGGDWYAAGYGGNGSYYEGGLGIGSGMYRSIAGHSALLDSPIAQMRVAEIVLARYGRGAWACPVP